MLRAVSLSLLLLTGCATTPHGSTSPRTNTVAAVGAGVAIGVVLTVAAIAIAVDSALDDLDSNDGYDPCYPYGCGPQH